MLAERYENQNLHKTLFVDIPQSIGCIKHKIYFKINLGIQQIGLHCKGSYMEIWQFLAYEILNFSTKSEN
jgi:hypothetical protein